MNQTTERNKATGVVTSMTGYGYGQAEIDSGGLRGLVVCEIRSVNSRFIDVQLRLADELRALEPALRDAVSRHIRRGKVECRLSWRAARSSATEWRIDETVLEQLNAAQHRIRALLPEAAPLTVAEVLALQAQAIDRSGNPQGDGSSDPGETAAALQQACAPLIERVLADCVATRRREGARLAGIIGQQLDTMQKVAEALRPKIPALLDDARQKLTTRLAEAMPADGVAAAAASAAAAAPAVPATGPADGGARVGRDETFARIRQEVALLSLRGDVTEELDRLQVHLDEARQVARDGGSIGKRLDFLSQELNREANTIASKAIGIAVTDAAVELKLANEQLREQVQNLE